MTNVARLTDPERVALAKYAYNICNTNCIDWISALEISQEKLFPLEKRYAKATLKCKSNIFIELLKKEKIDFDPIIHNNKVAEAQLNSVCGIKYNPALFNNSNMRFGFANPNPNNIQSGMPYTPMTMHRPEFNQNTNSNMQQKSIPFDNFKSAPGLNNFTFVNKINELASCLVKQFETQLTTELNSALNTALGNVERNFAKKLDDARKITGKVKQQLLKVMVIGVMGDVAFQTESEYGEMLDLRFYKQEENLNLIRSQSKHCDYVILIVGHINHGHQDCVRNHPGLIFCNGGVTQMKEILLTLACK